MTDPITRKNFMRYLWDRALPALSDVLASDEVGHLRTAVLSAGKDERFVAAIREHYRTVKMLEATQREVERLRGLVTSLGGVP